MYDPAVLRTLPFALLAGVMTLPAWIDPARRVLGRAEGELRDHVWVSWLVQRRIFEDGALPLHFPLANFPYGLDLYPLDPLNQAALALASLAIGLLPAYALLTTALLALIGVGGARLARACGASEAGACAAGLLCMLGPPLLGPVLDTQTEGMGAGWMLLLLAELAQPWDRARALRAGLFGAALVASAPYQAHGIALVAVPLALWRGGARLVGFAAVPALLAAVVLGGALWSVEGAKDGHLATRERNGEIWPPRTVIRGDDVAPPPEAITTASPVQIGAYARTPALSPPSTGPRRFAGWALPLAALFAAARDRRARVLVAGSLLYASLALGSARELDFGVLEGRVRIPLPYDLFYRFFPLGHYAWKPAQYAIPAWVLACTALSLLRGSPLAAAVVALELQLRGPTPLPLPAVSLGSARVYDELVGLEGAVVEFPCRSLARGGIGALPADVLLGQLRHGLPVGENLDRGVNSLHRDLLVSLAEAAGWRVRDPQPLGATWRRAASAGYRWLIVHERLLSPEELTRLRARIAPLDAPATPYDEGQTRYALEAR